MSKYLLPAAHPLENRNLLAIDYGEKFMGLATFMVGKDPYPLAFGRIAVRNNPHFLKELCQVISDTNTDCLIIGLPLLTDGKATSMTQKVQVFIDELKHKLSIPVYEQDETLSSFEAKERMKNSPIYNFKIDMNKIDEISATIILEDFISRCQRGFLL